MVMSTRVFITAVPLLAFILLASVMQSRSAVEDDAVTYGSAIKLQHADSKFYLHSHQIQWGSGSGQQSVTGHGGTDDQGSLWLISEGNKASFKEAGDPVLCGNTVRLSHVQTGKNLHSHLFQSPLTSNQEVSAFGDSGRGDTGDNWEIICKATAWRRGQDIKLRHLDTNRYLYSSSSQRFTQKNCPGCPIVGQQEVVCTGNPGDKQTSWKAHQGVFFHPKTESRDEL